MSGSNTIFDSILNLIEREVGSTMRGETKSLRQSMVPAPAPAPAPAPVAPQMIHAQHSTPIVDVYDIGAHYELIVEAAGATRESIEVRITNPRTLVISFEKPHPHLGLQEEPPQPGRPNMREVQYGTFMRGLMFKAEIDQDTVRARFENGVIVVILPKRTATIGRRIALD